VWEGKAREEAETWRWRWTRSGITTRTMHHGDVFGGEGLGGNVLRDVAESAGKGERKRKRKGMSWYGMVERIEKW